MVLKKTLSPRELASALGVGESTVKRWADDGQIEVRRTAGGHRRIHISEALRFVRATGLPLDQADILGLTKKDAAIDASALAIKTALLDGDEPRFTRFLMDHYATGGDLATLCDGPIRDAFVTIGELWQHQNDGILIEHRAVDCCLQGLNSLRTLMPRPRDGAPLAVGGAPAGDPYLLPSVMLGMVLLERGWRTANLGPNTPIDTLVTTCATMQPRLVWLAISAPTSDATPADCARLAQACAASGIELILGGRCANAPADAANINTLPDMRSLSRFADGLKASLGAEQVT